MIRVIIVEDEKPILDLMTRLISQHSMLEVVGTFESAAEALAGFGKSKPDAAFLDVEMPRMSGIELAEKLKSMNDSLQIVFTTAYPEYALEAFRVSAVDYLLKPVEPEGIERVAARLTKHRVVSPDSPSAKHDIEPCVRCFGTFETRGRDGSLINWPTRKTEELFAYLQVYPNRLIGKWQLADLLWPDLEEARAIHNLHNSIYRLKKSLKEAGITVDLTHTNEGYLWRVSPGFSDVGDFLSFTGRTAIIDGGNAKEGQRHFRMYRGALFGAKDYVWSAGAAADLALQYARLTRMLVAYHRDCGNRTEAKETLLVYLARMPLDEEMNGELLRLYLENEETEPFRRHYERYRQHLTEELGVEPSAEITGMVERIG